MSNSIGHSYHEFERSGWERAASAYANSFENVTALFVAPLLEAVGIHKKMQLLDVACGTGAVASASTKVN